MNVIELRLREMERTALNISLNDNLKYFRIKDGLSDSEAVNELNKYKSSNEFVYDIALYYNNNDKQGRIIRLPQVLLLICSLNMFINMKAGEGMIFLI